jgi:hypothetical protein
MPTWSHSWYHHDLEQAEKQTNFSAQYPSCSSGLRRNKKKVENEHIYTHTNTHIQGETCASAGRQAALLLLGHKWSMQSLLPRRASLLNRVLCELFVSALASRACCRHHSSQNCVHDNHPSLSEQKKNHTRKEMENPTSREVVEKSFALLSRRI